MLPYKVLKALEPELYRNVEFDVWHDGRKGKFVFNLFVKCDCVTGDLSTPNVHEYTSTWTSTFSICLKNKYKVPCILSSCNLLLATLQWSFLTGGILSLSPSELVSGYIY